MNENTVLSALIFPGQGSQYPGMGKNLYSASSSARQIFDAAERQAPGLLQVMFEGPAEDLTLTKFSQPAIFTHSVAALKAFESEEAFNRIQPAFACGHSLGEYSALVACGVVDFETGLALVQKRAQFMDEATRLSKGSMVAVMGLEAATIEKICSQHAVELANYNTPDQTVITGKAASIETVVSDLKEAGAKRVIPLAVSGAFHSSLMNSAAEKFAPHVDAVELVVPRFLFLSNVDAVPTKDPSLIKQNLTRQITSSVQWVKIIQSIASAGVTHFIEIGPGKVLKGLLRKINRELMVENIENAEDISRVCQSKV